MQAVRTASFIICLVALQCWTICCVPVPVLAEESLREMLDKLTAVNSQLLKQRNTVPRKQQIAAAIAARRLADDYLRKYPRESEIFYLRADSLRFEAVAYGFSDAKFLPTIKMALADCNEAMKSQKSPEGGLVLHADTLVLQAIGSTASERPALFEQAKRELHGIIARVPQEPSFQRALVTALIAESNLITSNRQAALKEAFSVARQLRDKGGSLSEYYDYLRQFFGIERCPSLEWKAASLAAETGMNTQIALVMSKELLARRQPFKAAQICDRLIEQDPDKVPRAIWFNKAGAEIALGNGREVVRSLNSISPQLGDWKQFNVLLRQSPLKSSDLPVGDYSPEAEIFRGCCFEHDWLPKKAGYAFMSAANRLPDGPLKVEVGSLAVTNFENSADYELAWNLARQLIGTESSLPTTKLARSYARLGYRLQKYADILPKITALIASSSDPKEFLLWRADVYTRLGSFKEAIADMEDVVEANPSEVEYRQELSTILIKQKEYSKAITHLSYVIDRQQSKRKCLLRRAFCYKQLGEKSLFDADVKQAELLKSQTRTTTKDKQS